MTLNKYKKIILIFILLKKLLVYKKRKIVLLMYFFFHLENRFLSLKKNYKEILKSVFQI